MPVFEGSASGRLGSVDHRRCNGVPWGVSGNYYIDKYCKLRPNSLYPMANAPHGSVRQLGGQCSVDYPVVIGSRVGGPH